MKIIHFFAIALIISTSSAWALMAPPREKLLGAESFTLKNGMQVVVIPNHRAPVVTAMVWYKIGSSDELRGKTGLAHFLEHLMFKGSPNVPPGELSRRVRAMGGNDNAFTTQDYTSYHQTIAVSHLAEAMAMEADRMRALSMPADQFESERQVVLEERRQRTENDPRSYFMDQLRHALFPANPYGVPVIGWEQDIKQLTREDAMAWHDHWYAPNNAILVVAGDITATELKPMAEKAYGDISTKDIKRMDVPPVNEFPGLTNMTLRDPRIHQSQFVRIYRAPSTPQNKADSMALEVLQEIMSGNSSTRLYQSLVVKQKLATSASLGYQDTVRGLGTISVGLTPEDGVPLEKVETAFDAEIKNLVDNGITDEELSSAKTRMKDSIAFMRDSLSDPAHIVGAALSTGQSLDDIEYWAYDVDAVTADQVKDVAKKYLLPAAPGKPSNYVNGYIIATEPGPGGQADIAPPAQEIR